MGTFSEWSRCKKCGHPFLVLANWPTPSDVCPRCRNPKQFRVPETKEDIEFGEEMLRLQKKKEGV